MRMCKSRHYADFSTCYDTCMKTIKDLPQLERPREKIARYGPGRLTNAELLATILRSGTSRCSVTQLAQRILQAFPYDQLASATVDQLQCIDQRVPRGR